MRRPELGAALLVASLAGVAGAEPAKDAAGGNGPLDMGSLGSSKEPITVTSDTLEYDYKNNIVVYRGEVNAVQGQVKLRSDRLTVTLVRGADKDDKDPKASKDPKDPKDAKGKGAGKAEAPAPPGNDNQKVREIVAEGSVRIDSGTRWATGGKATFDQTTRTLVLTVDPKLHDGENEVAGDRVVVYLDEDRSIVEGGRKRVKAVLYPDKDSGLVPKTTASAPAAPNGTAEAPVVQGDARTPAAGTAGP